MFSLIWISIKIGTLLTIYGFAFTKLVHKSEANWIMQRLLPITVGLFVTGVLFPSIWLYWALICILIPTLSRTTAEAACLYVLTVLMTPTAQLEMNLGSMYLLTFDKWLFAGIGLIIAVQIRRSRARLPVGWFDLFFVLIITLELIQARGMNVTSTLRSLFGTVVVLILPYFVVSRSLRQPSDIRRLMFTIAFAGFVLSCEAVYELRFKFLPYDLISQHLGSVVGISAYSKQRAGSLRASTSFEESTSFGLFLAIAFLAMLASHDIFKNRQSRLIGLMVMLAGLYAANARSAILSLVLGVLAYDFYRKRYGAMIVKLAGIVGLGLMALSAAQFSPRLADRLGVSGSSVDSTDYRALLLRRGMEEIRKHPWTGTSSAEAKIALADIRQGEGIIDFVNAYVFYGLTAGIGGIIIMIVCFFGTALRMLAIRKRLQKTPGLVQVGAVVFAVSLFTAVTAFTSGFGGKGSMIFYIVMAISSALGTRRAAVARPPQIRREEPAPIPVAVA
ncbi:O-antigen ligase [Sphingomonas sp.]|uniref:O-antigen ligase family protein n=1 Tax=Sphingomonas sp. TaxID=28214 RepID=UPI000DB01F0C|nr:O-antigen ligase family protein [Sphingomonas sp.]PZU10697.1 MAG: hypothetical protein DI605_03315 [Sphingomonas sp.]